MFDEQKGSSGFFLDMNNSLTHTTTKEEIKIVVVAVVGASSSSLGEMDLEKDALENCT